MGCPLFQLSVEPFSCAVVHSVIENRGLIPHKDANCSDIKLFIPPGSWSIIHDLYRVMGKVKAGVKEANGSFEVIHKTNPCHILNNLAGLFCQCF